MGVEGFGRLRNSLDRVANRFSVRTRRVLARALFACACALLFGYATFSVFFKDVIARTEGKQPIDITEFANGATVTHAFRMDGDSLHAVTVRIVADQPSSLSVACKLLRLYDGDPGAENHPNLYTEIYRWTDTLRIRAGDHWQRIDFPSVGESNDKWYAFEIRALNVTPNGASQQPGGGPGVRLMASEDNPDRGGELWINGARQPGSLFIRAHSGTMSEQLGLRDESILPDVLRHRAVQAVVVVAFYVTFAALAYRVLFGRAGHVPSDSDVSTRSLHPLSPRSPKEPSAADQLSEGVKRDRLFTIAIGTSVFLALCGLFVAPGNAEHAIPLVPEASLFVVLMFSIAAWARTREASQQNWTVHRTERFLLRAAFSVLVFWTFSRLLGGLTAAPGPCTHVAPSLIAKAECFLRVADGENWGIKNFSTLILTLGVGVASACWVRVGARNWRALAFAVIGVCVLHAVLGFVAVFSGATQLLPKWLAVNPWGRDRFTFVIPNPSWVWPHLAPGLAWVLWLALSVTRWPRLFPISGAFVLSAAIVSTKQRGGLLLLVLLWGCAASVWIWRRFRSTAITTVSRFVRLSGFLLCYVAGAIALAAWLVSKWFAPATGRGTAFTDQRIPAWSVALNALLHHDAVWGFGYGSWYSAFRKIVAGTEIAGLGFGTAHNFWVQLIFEHGLLGFLIITSLMLVAVFVAFQNVKFMSLGRELLFLQLIVVLTCTMVQAVDDVRPVLMTFAVTWGTLFGMPFRSPVHAGGVESESAGLLVLRRQALSRNALGLGLCMLTVALACLVWFARGAFGFDGGSTVRGPVTRWLGKEVTIPVFGPALFWLFETEFPQKQGSLVLMNEHGPPLSLVVKKDEKAYLPLRGGTRLFPKRHRLYVSPVHDGGVREISANIAYPPRARPNLLPLLLTRNASRLFEEGAESWIDCASTCEIALDAELLDGFVPVLTVVAGSHVNQPGKTILWGVRLEDSPHVELPAQAFQELQFNVSGSLPNVGELVLPNTHRRSPGTQWVLLVVHRPEQPAQGDTRVVRVSLMPQKRSNSDIYTRVD
jgi:hypothetical protein